MLKTDLPDVRMSHREQQFAPAVVSTVQTLEHPVFPTALPLENLGGKGLLSPVNGQVHVV